MQFYTFLETSLVTIILLSNFIAFFNEGEIPASPESLATTFLTFGEHKQPSVIDCLIRIVEMFPLQLITSLVSIFSVLNLAFALSVLGLLVMHLSLVAANITTIEASG